MKGFLPTVLAAALFLGIASSALGQSPRPMVVDDLFRLQTMGDAVLSRDGTSLAIVIQRAWSDPETFRPYDMLGNDHADIWILPVAGGPPLNVTRGARDGSGYWNPVWSPDGQRLALLSTAGGDNVRLYVWDKHSGRLQRMAERGVDLRVSATANADGSSNPIQWVDDRRLLVAVLPEGEQPAAFRLRRQTPRAALNAWAAAARGREATSSVLESGVAAPLPAHSSQLLLIDAVTRAARALVEHSLRHAVLSPNKEHVAIVVQDRPPAPEAGRPFPAPSSARSRLGIIALRDGSGVRWVDELFNPSVGQGMSPHRWSARGSMLAVLASETPEPGAAKQVFVVSPREATARKWAEGFTASAVAWSENEQLLALARPAGEAQRFDWWRLAANRPNADALKLTGGGAVPAEVIASTRPAEVIGVADGELWSLDLANGSRQNLTEKLVARISAVVWPRQDQRHGTAVSSVIVRATDAGTNSFVQVDLSPSGVRLSTVAQPPDATSLAAYHPERQLAVFAAPQHPQGSFLWTARGQGSDYVRRIALNDHLAGIADPQRTLIQYRSANGEDLQGVLLLPVGYEQGKRYPLVTWVYPGFVVQGTTMGFWVNKNQAHMDNLHILAGQGYAVLIPSMPTQNRPRDPFLELSSGVLPAVDRAIALGIADPERIAVIGQSAGGFATYGLITQTARFKAAIAISGYANLASNYGTFRGDERYTHGVDEKLTQARFSEGDVVGLGAPPWQDSDRYTRNSPLFFLDRVATPLLILHGDLDYVPIQQAEEVFTNLYRLGKRARFVRYWGEGHGAGDSAANIRDRWRQILGWLQTYVREAP